MDAELERIASQFDGMNAGDVALICARIAGLVLGGLKDLQDKQDTLHEVLRVIGQGARVELVILEENICPTTNGADRAQ
jgi:hypothetical protein